MKTILYIYAGYLLIMSLISLIFYRADKKKAQQKKWRTSEAVLLNLGFFGGALGAVAAMKMFRHKTKHWYFWAANIIGLLWQIAVLLLLMKSVFQP